MNAAKESARATVTNSNVVSVAVDQFEAASRAAMCSRAIYKLQRAVGTVQPDEGRRPRARIWKEPERSSGDDAERPFRADEEALHVIAGVVLAQLTEGVDNAAVSEHGFDAGHEITRIAIGDDIQAAGVGRDVSANRACAFRRQRQRKEAIDCERPGLCFAERDA